MAVFKDWRSLSSLLWSFSSLLLLPIAVLGKGQQSAFLFHAISEQFFSVVLRPDWSKPFPLWPLIKQWKISSRVSAPSWLLWGGSAITQGSVGLVEVLAWARLAGVARLSPKHFLVYCMARLVAAESSDPAFHHVEFLVLLVSTPFSPVQAVQKHSSDKQELKDTYCLSICYAYACKYMYTYISFIHAYVCMYVCNLSQHACVKTFSSLAEFELQVGCCLSAIGHDGRILLLPLLKMIDHWFSQMLQSINETLALYASQATMDVPWETDTCLGSTWFIEGRFSWQVEQGRNV